LEETLLTNINQRFDTLYNEIKLIRLRLEAIEEMLSEEELGEDDKKALREALEEHRRGETVSLEEALRRTKYASTSRFLAEPSNPLQNQTHKPEKES